jgi:hypothetical protein
MSVLEGHGILPKSRVPCRRTGEAGQTTVRVRGRRKMNIVAEDVHAAAGRLSAKTET